MELGIDKVRINPGNIGDEARIKQVVDMAKEKQIPIRIGVNSGSLEKELVEKYDGVTPQGLVESAMKHVHILEKFGFYDIVVSIKASDVPFSIEAYRLLSEAIPYPIHVGITEAGTPYAGTIKSAVGIGTILGHGYRGHDSCFPDRRPYRRNPRGERNSEKPWSAPIRCNLRFLPRPAAEAEIDLFPLRMRSRKNAEAYEKY